MSEGRLRLQKLLEHWIEHNEEHLSRFREAADEASKIGATKVAKDIRSAAEKGTEVSKHLRKALDALRVQK